MKWYLIAEEKDDIWPSPLDTKSREEVAKSLMDEWKRGSGSKRLYAIHADEDEDGCIDYETEDDMIEVTCKSINFNNGSGYFYDSDEVDMLFADYDENALIGPEGSEKERKTWEVITNLMDNDTRELVHNMIAPCSDEEFLRTYLYFAPDDLIIG